MKIIRWIDDNILFLITLVLLAFIPLYPKFPLLDIKHTFVYIRLEDFVISAAFIIFFIQLLRGKTTLRTPLTWPIIIFWITGLIATLLGIIFLFPHLPGLFPHIAALFYLRHIEYLAVFFVAYSAMRDKRLIPYVIGVLVLTLLVVVFYGFGQRFVPQYFPAYSTMNEEFAKGLRLILSVKGRIQATFAGHYDLGAYLVMMIPITGSLVFAFKRWSMRLLFVVISVLALFALMMTASRTSFAMYLMAVVFMLVLQKRKVWIIPVVIASIVLLFSFQGIYQRYASTLKEVNVVYDQYGNAIGIAEEGADGSVIVDTSGKSTGEDLPQSQSKFIETKEQVGKVSKVVVKKSDESGTSESNLTGDFTVKKAVAYDISFTTRFQGQWPRALEAFQRNILFGSGYSSINLATDGNYLRMLGETGILGTLSFLFIFLVYGVYVYKSLPHINSPLAKSFVIGITAGIFGLSLNAVLIDVFEASKIAFILWLLVGVSMGIMHLYHPKKIDLRKAIPELRHLPKEFFASFRKPRKDEK